MADDFLAEVMGHLGVRLAPGETSQGFSGSAVRLVRRQDGQRYALKVTSLRSPSLAIKARREYDVYRELAGRLPVRTPDLIDSHEDNDGLALLLSLHESPRPATLWTPHSWSLLASELARLHESDIPDPGRWRIQESPLHALIAPVSPQVEDFWRNDLSSGVGAVINARDLLIQKITEAGESFVHGDFHTENILFETGDHIWIDWQSTGMGSPAREIAFLSVRMTPGGAQLPQEFLSLYCRERNLDLGALQTSVLAAELGILLFEWPQYAGFNSAEGNQRVRLRTRELAASLLEIVGRV